MKKNIEYAAPLLQNVGVMPQGVILSTSVYTEPIVVEDYTWEE